MAPKKIHKWTISIIKDVQHHQSLEKANQNHNDILLHTSRISIIIIIEKGTGEDVEKPKHLYTAGGNVT